MDDHDAFRLDGMKPSDWMQMTPSDWMNRTFSGWWNKSYGDLINTKPSDWWTILYGAGTATQASGAPPTMPPAGTVQKHHRHHRHPAGCCCEECSHSRRHHDDHDCHRCGPDPCECFCCIGDVDLAVYSRVGEQRVIPVVVENERRRDKQITLELSDWTTRGGKPAPVETVALEPKTFTLAACAQQKVTLVVRVRGDDTATTNQPNPTLNQPPGRPLTFRGERLPSMWTTALLRLRISG